jgi:hypothetical protein
MRELFRLPWERGEATPTGRAAKMAGTQIDPGAEAPFVGVGPDEKLLTLMAATNPPGDRIPKFPISRAVLISGLPNVPVAASLAATRYRDVTVEFCPEPIAGDTTTIARRKAEIATRWGCTHFIECDAEQAIGISAHAPHLIVTWWSVAIGRGWIVGAAAQPEAP